MWSHIQQKKQSNKKSKEGGESWAKFENGVVSNIAGLYRIGS